MALSKKDKVDFLVDKMNWAAKTWMVILFVVCVFAGALHFLWRVAAGKKPNVFGPTHPPE